MTHKQYTNLKENDIIITNDDIVPHFHKGTLLTVNKIYKVKSGDYKCFIQVKENMDDGWHYSIFDIYKKYVSIVKPDYLK